MIHTAISFDPSEFANDAPFDSDEDSEEEVFSSYSAISPSYTAIKSTYTAILSVYTSWKLQTTRPSIPMKTARRRYTGVLGDI